MGINRFVIRVYGIFINESGKVLVSDELIRGKRYIKFPGGGMEFGESTIDCVVREMKEETGLSFRVKSHFYTTDFFVESAFDDTAQVISIYYLIEPDNHIIQNIDESFSFEKQEDVNQKFRFIPIEKLNESDLTLIIDQRVAALIKAGWKA